MRNNLVSDGTVVLEQIVVLNAGGLGDLLEGRLLKVS